MATGTDYVWRLIFGVIGFGIGYYYPEIESFVKKIADKNKGLNKKDDKKQ